MKKKIKNILSEIVYFLYRHHILKNHLQVMSVDETIEELLTTEKSMIRFGDGEIVAIEGNALVLQKSSEELSNALKYLLGYPYDGILTTVQGIFDGVEQYQDKSKKFWKEHLFSFRKVYYKYCNLGKIYGDTCISRGYYVFEDKTPCFRWYAKIRMIWENRDIVVVEGETTHNGVGNDLFDTASLIERVICPSSNAYSTITEIEDCCLTFPKDRLFLVSLGATAKPLVEFLFLAGYRALDIGNMDMEYEWFLMNAQSKVEIPKHSVIGEEANRIAGYDVYLSQVRYWITQC